MTDPIRGLVQAVIQATVRVDSGSGVVVMGPSSPVVVTAAHVLHENENRISHVGRTYSVDVLLRSEHDDIAILTDRAELSAIPLTVASDCAAGERVVLGGFPLGWEEDEALVAIGWVGGVRRHAEELWLNLDSSWGHSGGPVVAWIHGEPCLVGIVLGPAGKAHEQLEDLRDTASYRMSLARDLVWQAGHKGRPHRIGGDIPFESPWEVVKDLGKLAERSIALQQSIVLAVEDHFRTGFVRARAGSTVRRRLGFEAG